MQPNRALTLTSAEFPRDVVAGAYSGTLAAEGPYYFVPARHFPYGPVSIRDPLTMNGMEMEARVRLEPSNTTRVDGWRSVCEFGGVRTSDGLTEFGFEATFEGGRLQPGEEKLATLWLWALPYQGVKIAKGMQVVFREGWQIVARGVVVEEPRPRQQR